MSRLERHIITRPQEALEKTLEDLWNSRPASTYIYCPLSSMFSPESEAVQPWVTIDGFTTAADGKIMTLHGFMNVEGSLKVWTAPPHQILRDLVRQKLSEKARAQIYTPFHSKPLLMKPKSKRQITAKPFLRENDKLKLKDQE